MYHFGVGNGRLSKAEIKRRSAIARRHGAEFVAVHGNQGNCVCGHGCRLDTCPTMHYWFSCPNRGAPFDRAVAQAVMAEVLPVVSR